ncbi:acyltransferase [Paenibacillus allorhizosphaerae]|uniref:2,3,4,5-tetrahydropyridine-2,6-dicarboxylate N-acetyltransferase n=1 Tax=Paenibacillus allorhizosphaerae TaxID=2849866 RepID=A0ABM8VEV9_9BACL|nr:acyltransferase [Paenibacillus allorhizosphaerae]CAG7632678.1 2,3,4,5-tetrahydropyridine-2,6-dicarboxylate N-acetyltransferase [Paenibacillus allorhizosphaerae]
MTAKWKRKIAGSIKRFLDYYTKDQTMDDKIAKLRKSGMTIGSNVFIYDSMFDAVYPWLITIGNHCTLTRTEILTHDDSLVLINGRRYVAPVNIGDYVFIGRGSIIMPGVTIGSRVIVGSGSIVTKDVADGSVVAGNPAKVIGTVDDVVRKREAGNQLIPYRMKSNLVENDEDEAIAMFVRSWKESNYKSWDLKAN